MESVCDEQLVSPMLITYSSLADPLRGVLFREVLSILFLQKAEIFLTRSPIHPWKQSSGLTPRPEPT